MDPDSVISHKFPVTAFKYNERDVVLYALGIGACGRDALDEKELNFVYHQDGQSRVKVLPTYVTVFTYREAPGILDLPGLEFDPRMLLHGQQYIEIYKTLPTSSSLQNKQVVAGLHDKGKAAVVELEMISYEKESGEPLCLNRSTLYLRGAGGFSKSSKPFSYSNYPEGQVFVQVPKTKPTAMYEDNVKQDQALLYRLSGDYNPLHSDPMVAKIAGFERPILHGLCSLGFAVRAVVNVICNGEPSSVKVIFGRFLHHVYPGETLVTEMWLDGFRVTYQTKVKERGKPVLHGFVDLRQIPSSL
ncbi:enoyl-CoA hydratase 2 [Wolffia australiana]